MVPKIDPTDMDPEDVQPAKPTIGDPIASFQKRCEAEGVSKEDVLNFCQLGGLLDLAEVKSFEDFRPVIGSIAGNIEEIKKWRA
jgi:hypothetical protein